MGHNTALSGKKRRLPLIFAAVAAIIALAVAAAGFFLYSLFDTRVPGFVNKAENTLLRDSQTVLLGHANVTQLVKMESVVRDVEPAAPGPDSDGLLDQLQLNGIDPRQQLEQIIFSFNVDTAIGPYANILALTSASPDTITGFLNQYYETDIISDDGFDVIHFRKQNVKSCQYGQTRALVVGDGFVAISHPDKVAALYRQLQTADASQVVNQQWVDYRSQRLLSLGLLQPDQVNDTTMGIAGLLLRGLQEEWQSMEAVFAGIQGKMVPPSVDVDFTVASDDPQWIASRRDKLQQVLDSMNPGDNDLLIQLQRKIAIAADNRQLGTHFTIDRELVDAGENLLEEGLGSLFSFSGGNNSGSSMGLSNGAVEQRIDEDPQLYQSSISLADIPAFENRYNESLNWIDGPFAGKINAVSINRDGLTTVEIGIETQDMPNPPGSDTFGNPGGITTVDVKDAEGKSLLQRETCGENLNHQPAAFQFGSWATKKVRLKPGANIEDVDTIEGQVEMRIATQTETETLTLPLQNTRYSNQGTELNIGKIENSAVSYSIGGTPGGFLALRALNKDGQYLESSGTFSMGGSTTHQFYGEIHSLELVKALSYDTIAREFTFDSASPPHASDNFGTEPEPFQGYDTRDWDQVLQLGQNLAPETQDNGWLGEMATSTRAGPAGLSLYRPDVFRSFDGPSLNGELVLEMPYVKALEEKSNAIQLHISELHFDSGEGNGETVAHPRYSLPIQTRFSGLKSGNYKDSTKPETELRKDIYLNGRTSLDIPLNNASLDNAQLSQLTGEVQFNLPVSVQTQSMTNIRLGGTLSTDDFTLTIVSIGEGSITLQSEGDLQSLVDVQVVSNDNKLIGNAIDFSEEQPRFGVKPNYRGEPEPPVRTLGELQFTGTPASIVVVTADESAVFKYPVELSL